MIVGFLVSAPAICAVSQSDGWILGLCCCHLQFTKSFVKSFAPAPVIWQLTRPIFKMLVSAPATIGVQRIDCQISSLCACHRAVYGIACQNFCSCACHLAVDQIDFENDGVCACHPVEFSGLIVGSLVCLPPVQFTRVIVIVGSSCILVLCACHPCKFSNCWSLRPPSLQFTKLLLKMLVCAPATGAVKRIDCQIPDLCACHPCSLPE